MVIIMNNDWFIVKVENYIDKGIVTLWSFKQDYPYLVYRAQSGEVRVNTYFKEKSENEYECCKYCDRLLTNSIEEYERLSKKDFESQVYGSWMDGAR